MIACAALGVGHLHTKGYIYRDLKPENLLMDEKGYIYLSDFGLVKLLKPNEKANSFCGTPEYMAPEVIINEGYDRCADWWSLGILLYELIFNSLPFYHENVQ